MDNTALLNELIRAEIKKQYRSDRKFAQTINIPPTTLSSILKNGVQGTAFDTVMKICDALNIKIVYDNVPVFIDNASFEMLCRYNKMDATGKKNIDSEIKQELRRVNKEYAVNCRWEQSFSADK